MKHKIFVLSIFFSGVVCLAQAQQVVTLDQVIVVALERGYDVQIARGNAALRGTDDKYASAAFLPQINGVASTTWSDTDQDFKFADETRNTSGNAESNNVAASLQLVWTLFDGTRMFSTRERIRQTATQSDLQLKDQMVNTISNVIVNYFNIVRQKQQLRAIQEQMSVNEERVKLAERKLDVGTGAKPELLQAKVDLNAQKTSVLQQEATIQQLKDLLNALVGMALPIPFDVVDSIELDSQLIRSEVLSKMENGNFAVLAAQKNISIAQLTLQERRAERLPFLNFNASYNFTHNDNTKLINPFSSVQSEFKGFNYGLSVSVPILNALNVSRQTKLASINLQQQNLVYEQVKATTNAAANIAYVSYDNAIKILQVEEENILLAKENVSIALESFKGGISTFIELRTAQQSLETAYNRLITARYNAKVAETELLRLSGALLK